MISRRQFVQLSMANLSVAFPALALQEKALTEEKDSVTSRRTFHIGLDGGMIIPAYFYPSGGGVGDRFEQLAWAANWLAENGVDGYDKLIAIVNVNNGPGKGSDKNYSSAIQAVQKTGGIVIGYVATGYGEKDFGTIITEIDEWLRFYPSLNGIFLDEWHGQDPADSAFYQNLNQYITVAKGLPRCVVNPGIPFDNDLLNSTPASWATEIIVHENTAANSTNILIPKWIRPGPHVAKGAILIHTMSDSVAVTSAIIEAKAKRARWFFITDDPYLDPKTDNPWDTLPGETSGGTPNKWNEYWGNLLWSIAFAQ